MKNRMYKIEIILLIISFLLIFITNNTYRNIIAGISTGIILFSCISLYGNKRDNDFYKWSATRIIIAVLLFYFILTLFLGLILGFNKTLLIFYSKQFFSLMMPLVLILIEEYIRFILIKKNIGNFLGIYFLTGIIIFFDIVINLNVSGLFNSYRIFVFICTIVFPIIANNILITYIIYNYGLLPALIYKLVINSYEFILPILPNLGDYLYGTIHIAIPFTIFWILHVYLSPLKNKQIDDKKIKKFNVSLIFIPLIIFLITIVILVSGIFKYQLIAIASNSMVPNFERGDAILVKKVDINDIKIGDILVFNREGKITTHRVVEIQEKDNNRFFYTKGDANNSVDEGCASANEIRGIGTNIIKCIGFPTILINEMFRR